MSERRDPDLDRLGDERAWDSDTRELARYLRATPHPYAHVEPTPQFRQALQRRLMREAWERASRPPLPWYRRLLAPQPMAWAGAAVGGVLIVFVAFFFLASPSQTDRIDVHVVSPQQNAQLVSTQTPIELQFNQPMDTGTVQVQVQPATKVQTQWQGNKLTITPVNGLSANTQYQVTVVSGQTATHQSVGRIQPVTFTTGPAPTPTPTPSARPTPTPSPGLNPHQIGPIGTPRAHWTSDGASLIVVDPNGQLQLEPVAGGSPRKLADGVSLVAVGPDGAPAWFSGGQVSWKTTTVSGVQPIALGFRQGGLLVATATDVETADQRRVTALKETADAADFSPAGDRLAYHAASGVHLVDLASGRDTLLGPGALGQWSAAGGRYAYATDAGVSVADAVAGTSTGVVALPGVTGISWSPGNQFLLATGTGLYLANDPSDGSIAPARKLQDGSFAQPDWAPAGPGAGQFSFRRGGELYVATVPGAQLGTITPAANLAQQDDLVSSFMNARKGHLTDQALQCLDAAGSAAFSRLSLVYSDPSTSLARWYVVLSQQGRVVVRLVLAHGLVQTAVDETLAITQPDSGGGPKIHGVTETPRSLFGAGPEVVSVVVTGSQVQVVFDSDLDPSSAVQQSTVGIRGMTTVSRFDSKQRTVTLTVPGGLTPGATYDLLIDPSLQDVNQRHANAYDLQFTGPTS